MRHLRDWSLIVLITTVPVGLLGGVIALGLRVVSDIRDEATFRANTGTSFKGIDDHLKKLDDSLSTINTKLDLRDQSGMTIKEFNHELPAVAASVKSATTLGLSTPEDVQNSLGQQLQKADPTAPGYWPAVAQFVTYRSQQEIPVSLRAVLLSPSLPRCHGQARVAPLDQNKHQTTSMLWSQCVVYFDDPFFGDSPRGKAWAEKGQLGDFVFKKCLVVYRGGHVDDFVAFSQFQDCIFLISSDTEPSQRAKAVIEFLLHSLPANSITIKPSLILKGQQY
jgi:hypothetical protein